MNAGFKGKFLQLDPIDGSLVPNGAIYLDINNGSKLTQKSVSGVPGEIGTSGGGNPLQKSMIADESFAPGKPLAKKTNGRVVLYDSDDLTRNVFIGFSTQAALAPGAAVIVTCIGQNIAGLLTGLGFAPGDTVYAGENPGTLVKYTDFTNSNDTITQVGIADAAGGVTGVNATDLIFFPQVITTFN